MLISERRRYVTMSIINSEYDPTLERYVEMLYEEAKTMVKEIFVRHIIGKLRASIALVRFNTRIYPYLMFDIRHFENEGVIGVEMHVKIWIDESLLRGLKERIRTEVYKNREDVRIKARTLRKILLEEIYSATYGVQDLFGSTAETTTKARRGRTAVRHKEGGLDNTDIGEDTGGGDQDLEPSEGR